MVTQKHYKVIRNTQNYNRDTRQPGPNSADTNPLKKETKDEDDEQQQGEEDQPL